MNKLLSTLKGAEVKKYFFNTSWMMGEKVITMGLALVVSIFVARYLGPERFGILSYAVSLSSLFAVATHMGLKGLAVRELVNNPDNHHELMGTVFSIKFIGALAAMVAFMCFVFFSVDSFNTEFWVLILVSGIILLKPFEVFDFWFQAEVKAKYSSLVKTISTLTFSGLQIIFVVIAANLLAFASVYLIKAFLTAGLFLFFFGRKSNILIRKWKISYKKTKELLGQGWMIMLGAIFAMVYLKIDQVMIRWLVNAEEVGVYSVAAKLSEAWYFIPGVIVTSLFPKLLELKKRDGDEFNHRLQQLFDLLFGLAFSIAIIVTFISGPVIDILYGNEFSKAAAILTIHIWAGLFIFMRAAFSKWILVEDAIAFSMITQGAGACANILLNLIFIPLYGGLGAATSTIISYAMASYVSLFFYKKSRPVFWMMSKSLVSPFRYLIKYAK